MRQKVELGQKLKFEVFLGIRPNVLYEIHNNCK